MDCYGRWRRNIGSGRRYAVNDEIKPETGDIWKELDPRPEYQRYVKVTEVRDDSVRIYKVRETEDGVWEADRPAPERWAQLKRFNGRRGGYELYRRPAGEPHL